MESDEEDEDSAQRTPQGYLSSSTSDLPQANLAIRNHEGISSPIVPAEKESDDPTLSARDRNPLQRISSSTRSQVNSLFTSQSTASQASSRHASFLTSIGSSKFVTNLASHVFNKGLLEGLHSDITVNVFGNPYRLHRLILVQSPFFASALSGPWLEASAAEIDLHPEETDPNITREAFEIALKRMYGSKEPGEENAHCLALFATACWLEMPEFRRECVAAIIHTMQPTSLGPIITLVTSNYYGKPGETILESAKALLRCEGSLIPVRSWDVIPGDIIKEIISSDEFFIHDEWHRWDLAKKILERKIRQFADDIDLQFDALATQIALRKIKRVAKSSTEVSKHFLGYPPPSDDSELSKLVNVYTNPDIVSILELLENDIYFMHFDFQELQNIKSSCDPFGIPYLATQCLDTALWSSMELRHKITASDLERPRLGLHDIPIDAPGAAVSEKAFEMHDQQDEDDESEHNTEREASTDLLASWWRIPDRDHHSTTHVDADSAQSFSWQSSKQYDYTSPHTELQNFSSSASSHFEGQATLCQFARIPPVRFSVEFPNPRLLDVSKHLHSRSIFYAGSFWNVYIRTWRPKDSKARTLAVYLRRTETDRSEEARPARSDLTRSVHQRITELERETLRQMRESRRRTRTSRIYLEAQAMPPPSDEPGSDGTITPTESFVQSLSVDEQFRLSKFLHDITMSYANGTGPAPSAILSAEETLEAENPNYTSYSPSPVRPPYVDPRPSVQAYFKIFCPSPGGGTYHTYESVPEEFSWRKSWGWKRAYLLDGKRPTSSRSEDGHDTDNSYSTSSKLRLSIVIGVV